MLNNKGFAVSAVLYTILIAFLLFLGVALANFSASANVISNANKDLVNGMSFKAIQVYSRAVDKDCGDEYEWYQNGDGTQSNTIVQIKSRYGTFYWPKDFEKAEMIGPTIDSLGVDLSGNESDLEAYSYNKKINVTYDTVTNKLRFCDIEISDCSVPFELVDICS